MYVFRNVFLATIKSDWLQFFRQSSHFGYNFFLARGTPRFVNYIIVHWRRLHKASTTMATWAYRILSGILYRILTHNVLRTIFRRFSGIQCACVDSGSQPVSPLRKARREETGVEQRDGGVPVHDDIDPASVMIRRYTTFSSPSQASCLWVYGHKHWHPS